MFCTAFFLLIKIKKYCYFCQDKQIKHKLEIMIGLNLARQKKLLF